MLKRFLTALALIALSAWSILRVSRPPRPVAASAPDTVFSAERAFRHVQAIAVRPHAIGMPDHDRVRDYIVGELTALGLRPEIQATTGIGTRYREVGHVQNILARLFGRDSGGKAVLLVSHYDGVEAGPSAADAGAGVAAVLETARALRARTTPLLHDVIVLITDGEEAGLLGAAAFVREHPWAKDVAAIVNVEARGTGGRSFMFETNGGNLDVARALRKVGGATAGSVFAAVYRVLPNDTDLSELSLLGQPSLNFAFANGVERYHTSRDDIEHLNHGSLQHHGDQVLGLAQVFGNEPLPRPKTGDGVYFDLPLFGLVVYPQSFAVPFAIVALVIVGIAAYRERKGIAVGVGAAIAGIVVATALARPIAGWMHVLQSHMPWDGLARWSGVHFVAVALLAIALALACLAVARRWATDRAIDAGVLIVWVIVAVTVSVILPAASYLLTWPVLFAAAAIALPSGHQWDDARVILGWIAAAVSILLIVGFTYGVSAIMLGVYGTGATALGVLTAMLALLLAPHFRRVAGDSADLGAAWIAVTGVILAVVGLFTVRHSADHPLPSSLAYVQHGDSGRGWFGTFAPARDLWTTSTVGTTENPPEWANRVMDSRARFWGRSVQRAQLDAPTAMIVRDSIADGRRNLRFRMLAPSGATALRIRASGTKVAGSTIDGRVVDTTRYRQRSNVWSMMYYAVPDSGAIVGLTIPATDSLDLELIARRPGVPLMVPQRPEHIATAQTGDVSYVYRRYRF